MFMPVSYAEEINLEYKIKSAFLLNFILFVEWPEQNLSNSENEIRLCLFGHDPFYSFIDELLVAKRPQFGLRNIYIDRIQRDTSVKNCHALFVPASEMKHINLETVARDDLLYIGESSDFIHHGGMINFYIEEDSIKFEINLAAVRRSKLKMSSQLLKLAHIVGE